VLVTTLTKRLSEDLTTYLREAKVRVEYLHSDIDALERVEILRNLRQGNFDVLIASTSCARTRPAGGGAGRDPRRRQEGFLRSATSLLQTAGRAARHEKGGDFLRGRHYRLHPAHDGGGDAPPRETARLQPGARITPRSVKRGVQASCTSTMAGADRTGGSRGGRG